VNLPGVTDSVSGVTESQSGVTNRASGVTADGVQTLIEPLQEPTYASKELFNEFWNEYPRKVDRGKALKAFKSALKRAKFEDILAGAIAYRNDPTRKPEFTKYPATWLNADAWENAAALPEVKAANEARRLKEKDASDAYLREQEEIAKQSVPLTPELKKKLGL
jgi:hypothetical protein